MIGEILNFFLYLHSKGTSVVILFFFDFYLLVDPFFLCSDWNPHADLQAMARAHRLGQTNKVG